MIKRKTAILKISSLINNQNKVISCLGRISRDLFDLVGANHNCFYLMGSMGSTLPFALGIAMGAKQNTYYAIEGDGSIIMNLGALLTFKRYNPNNLTLFILDNKQYETTGGQSSQPLGFELYNLALTTNLKSALVQNENEMDAVIRKIQTKFESYDIVIVRTDIDPVAPRISMLPPKIAEKFKQHLFSI